MSRGHVARREVRAREGHDGLDGAFGDTVQLVDVGRAGRLRHELVVKQLSELTRQKLTRVVRVERAHDADRRRRSRAGVRVHRGDEGADAVWRFRFGLEEVHELEPCVIVYQDERVLVAAEERRREGAHDVGVHKASA